MQHLQKQVRQKEDEIKAQQEELEKVFSQRLKQALEQWHKQMTDDQHFQQKTIEHLQAQLKDAVDQIKERDDQLLQVRADVEERFRGKEKEIDDLKHRLWAADLEINSTKEKVHTAKKMVDDKNLEIHDLKSKFQKSLERELELKREVEKIYLQKEKDVEDQERRISLSNQNLLKTMQKQRDEALLTVQEKKEQLEEIKNQYAQLQRVNDQLSSQLQLLENTKRQQDENQKYQYVSKAVEKNIDQEFGFGNLPQPSPLNSFNIGSSIDSVHTAQREALLRASIDRKQQHKIPSPQHSAHASVQENMIKQLQDNVVQLTQKVEELKRRDSTAGILHP